MHVSPIKKILESKKTSVLLIVLLAFGISAFYVRHHFENNHGLEHDFDLEYLPEKEQQDNPTTKVLKKGINILRLVLTKYVAIIKPTSSLFYAYFTFFFFHSSLPNFK